MAVFTFKTIQSASEGSYKEKGSKFLAFAFPAADEQAVKQHLEQLKKAYFDARHHCYAYVLGAEKKKFRAFDDGEPNHSAGDPILGQIRARDLTDVLAVVVRYFGGVKLGVGGLIGAYKAAAEDALNHAVILEKDVTVSLSIRYPYDATPELMRLVKEFNLAISHQEFLEACSMQVVARLADYDRLLEKINLLKATGTALTLE